MQEQQASAAKFTPGQYRAHPVSIRDGANVRFEIVAKNGDGDEFVIARTADDGSPTGEATAHLLAAAPELYAALQSIRDCATRHESRGKVVAVLADFDKLQAVCAAIAKAEGGTK